MTLVIRLYYNGPLNEKAEIEFSREEMHYLQNVRRGEELQISVFNRKGEEATGKFLKDRKLFWIEKVQKQNRSILHPIDLWVALPENRVVADLITSLSELGIESLNFFIGDRTQKGKVRIATWKDSDKAERLAIEADRQCERLQPLKIGFHSESLENILKILPQKKKILVFDEDPKGGSNAAEFSESEYCGLLGPEGGWSATEREVFQKCNLSSIHLSTPVLRVHTAAIAACVLLMKTRHRSHLCERF